MKAILIACLVFVFVSAAGAITISDPNVGLTEQQQESISTLFHLLVAVYDNDASLIPDEPNEIIALETSNDSRDQLAYVIFKMMQYESDPNSTPIEEETPVVLNEAAAEIVPDENSVPNMSSQALTSINKSAANWGNSFTFSAESLLFGEIELPPLQEPNEPTAVFIQSPTGSRGPSREPVDGFTGWSQSFEMLDDLDSEPNIIEINSDITTNQVWDANDVYYITAETVNVQALLVIEPGTTVIFGYQCGMFVNNGGTLISKGTPNEPIIYAPDYMYFSSPDYIGYYWQALASDGSYYYSPLHIQETASPATTIRYCMIEGAVAGIVSENIRLVQPIENNYLFGNVYGIFESGPKLTDIRNNLCFYNDEAGIEAYLADANGIADTDNIFTIEQNTCDSYQYCGITVHGVAEPNEVPTVHLLNNIVSSSYWYGLNLVDGYMQMLVVNTGYYDNGQNKNWEFDEYNPVVAQSNPYYPYIGEKPYWHHHLAEGSDFIDAGSQYIEQTKLIGTTTNFDGLPDKDIVDLGFHHTDWDFVGGEGIAGTDIDDLITLSNYWLTYTPYDPNSPNYQDPNIVDPNTISYGGDWNDDGFVDLADFAILAALWQAAPNEPNIVPVIIGNSNDSPIGISVTGDMCDTERIFAFISGRYIGEIFRFERGVPIEVDISDFGNKPQQLKFVAIDSDGYTTWSGPTNIAYTSPLSYCVLPQSYEPNEPVPFTVYCTGPNDVTVNVYADGGQLVWSQVFDGNSVSGSIPSVITANHTIDCVQLTSGSGATTLKAISPAISPLSLPDPNVIAAIVRPNRWLNWHDYKIANTVRTAFKNRGIRYVELVCKNATYANIAKYAPQLKYLYIDAHGFSAETFGQLGVLRTGVVLADGDCVSAKASDFVGTPPTWCKDPLPGHLEQTVHSFVTMGFTDLRFFYNDSCLGGHLTIDFGTGLLMWGGSGEQSLFDFVHNDMSVACGLTDTSQSRFYQGWFSESESGFPWAWPIAWLPNVDDETEYQKFSRNEWEALGEGEELYWALSEAIAEQDYFGPDSPAYNYRIKGQGDMLNLRIRSNP